jgi:hypothetical protein
VLRVACTHDTFDSFPQITKFVLRKYFLLTEASTLPFNSRKETLGQLSIKSLLIHALSLCALGTALSATNPVLVADSHQLRLPFVVIMVDTERTVKVPGNNNATYGPVPKADQLLDIEFLDIAPSPIPVYAHSLLHAYFQKTGHS